MTPRAAGSPTMPRPTPDQIAADPTELGYTT